MKVVLDTNVLVAAFLAEGLCSVLLTRARRKDFKLFICPEILDEFKRVLSQKIKVSPELVEEALDLILESSQIVSPTEVVKGVCRDEDDDYILSCALSAKADYLVSGDKDLLEMKDFEGIRIVSPREFETFFED